MLEDQASEKLNRMFQFTRNNCISIILEFVVALVSSLFCALLLFRTVRLKEAKRSIRSHKIRVLAAIMLLDVFICLYNSIELGRWPLVKEAVISITKAISVVAQYSMLFFVFKRTKKFLTNKVWWERLFIFLFVINVVIALIFVLVAFINSVNAVNEIEDLSEGAIKKTIELQIVVCTTKIWLVR